MVATAYSIFAVSQILGVYLVIMSIILFSRKSFYSSLIKNMKADNEVIFLAASIGLLLGIVLVGAHNTWVLAPHLMLTLLSWMVLILSILWLLDPKKMLAITQSMFNERGYNAVVGSMFIFGIILVFRGLQLFIK